MTRFGRAEEPRSVLSAGGGTFLARARAILFAALASRDAEMPRARPGLFFGRGVYLVASPGTSRERVPAAPTPTSSTRSVMPATRSATRSGKASLVEPAAPHWITSISSSDARRLHLIRWGWHLSQFLPFVLYYGAQGACGARVADRRRGLRGRARVHGVRAPPLRLLRVRRHLGAPQAQAALISRLERRQLQTTSSMTNIGARGSAAELCVLLRRILARAEAPPRKANHRGVFILREAWRGRS